MSNMVKHFNEKAGYQMSDRCKRLYKRTAAFLLAVTIITACAASVSAEGTTPPISGKVNSAYDARTATVTTTTAATTASTTATTAAATTSAASDVAGQTNTTSASTEIDENSKDAEQTVEASTAQFNADGTPIITAGSAVVMDCDTGMVLYGFNENAQMPMASTTKIMTCLLALESGDIGRTITVTEDCLDLLDGTRIGLQVGYKITMYDLCVAMMMYSGNDAANTAAVAVGGSIAGFVSMMNERAADIGMLNTHFDTPSGLDQFSDGAHYSTAYDMALLGREAMKNSDFRDIVGFNKHDIYYDEFPGGRRLVTHNYLMAGQKYGYKGCDGIKTGVTNLAGQCLVSHVTSEEGLSLVCVSLNNANRWNDHKTLYDYAKSLYEQVEVNPDVSDFDPVIVCAKKRTLAVECHADKTFNVLKTQKDDVKRELVYKQFIDAPIKEGDVVGYLQYSVNDVILAKYPIVAAETVESDTNGWFTDYLKAIEYSAEQN